MEIRSVISDALAEKLGNAVHRAVQKGYKDYVQRVHVRAVLGLQTDNPFGLVFVDLYNVVAGRRRNALLPRPQLLRVA